MIQTHENCPKSAMDKYYLYKQLPEYQYIQKTTPQKKDHHYYHDNYNIWNNRSQANQKNYIGFHQNQIENEPRIIEMKKQQEQDNTDYEVQRRVLLSQQRDNQLSLLSQRKNERKQLQKESNQLIQDEQDDLMENNVYTGFLQRSIQNQSNTALNGRANYLWNKMNKLSEKYLNQAINKKIISMDEEAVAKICEKIKRDESVQKIKEDLQKKNITEIRETFKQRHIKNLEFEKKVGLVPEEKVMVIRQIKPLTKSGSFYNRNTNDKQGQQEKDNNLKSRPATSNQVSITNLNQASKNDSDFSNKFINYLNYTKTNSQTSNSRIEALAQPRQKTNLNKNPLDRTEFKGLILSEVDELKMNLNTNFNKTIYENSTILKDTLGIIRPYSNLSKTKTNFSINSRAKSQVPIIQSDIIKQEIQFGIIQELDSFERRFERNSSKRVGFPNSTLSDMKKYN